MGKLVNKIKDFFFKNNCEKVAGVETRNYLCTPFAKEREWEKEIEGKSP